MLSVLIVFPTNYLRDRALLIVAKEACGSVWVENDSIRPAKYTVDGWEMGMREVFRRALFWPRLLA